MRVAVITEVFLPKIDGVVNRTLNLIRHLPRAGDDVLLVCPEAPGRGPAGVPTVAVPSFPLRSYPEYRIGLPDDSLTRAVRAFAPDVLHYVNPLAFGFRVHDLFRRAGLAVPNVFSFHTLYAEFAKQYALTRPLAGLLWNLTRSYHNRAAVNLTVSTVMQDVLRQRGFRNVELWPPAVDSDLFHPSRRDAALRARLTGGRPERPLLLTVSRLAPEKNVGFLADVLKLCPDACLAVVGDGPHRPELERRFAGTATHFAGYLKGEKLAAAYATADAFVYASEVETMGNVVLEAMSCGLPVVAPRAGGIPSVCTDGVTGFLYPPRDATEAARLTRELLKDVSRRAEVGRAARAAVEERNWEQAIGRVREAYARAVASGPLPALTWRDGLATATMAGIVAAFRLMPGTEPKPEREPALA